MYKYLTSFFLSLFLVSCSEPAEEIAADSFLNIAGAREGLASQPSFRLGFSSS